MEGTSSSINNCPRIVPTTVFMKLRRRKLRNMDAYFPTFTCCACGSSSVVVTCVCKDICRNFASRTNDAGELGFPENDDESASDSGDSGTELALPTGASSANSEFIASSTVAVPLVPDICDRVKDMRLGDQLKEARGGLPPPAVFWKLHQGRCRS
jgi:hypothetical protein